MKETTLLPFLRASRNIVFALLLTLFAACEKDTSASISSEPTVRVIFASSGLGDMSYNDNILRGILQARQEHSFQLEYVTPRNEEEAERTLATWKKEGDDPRSYFTILAASEYESVARRTMPATPVQNYLLFETEADDLTIPVFHFTGYGTSFLAGVAAYTLTQADEAAYIGGQQNEPFITECYDGFRDGYLYAGGKEVAETYLSTTQKGFVMPQQAYHMADSLYRLYPFIYAMAGNSNNGIYKYLRENPEGKYTAGIDVDQSVYSSQIIGSMIKEVDRCVKQYITAWINGEEIPMWQQYTLESGFMAFRIADRYKEKLEKVVDECLPLAINKEKEYEKNNPISRVGGAVLLQQRRRK